MFLVELLLTLTRQVAISSKASASLTMAHTLLFHLLRYAEVLVVQFDEADVVCTNVEEQELFIKDVLCESLW